jgi:hypothetical protein
MPTLRKSRSVGQPILWWCPRQQTWASPLSPDPARASWNAYAYPTNPNSFTDPSGLCPDCGRDHSQMVDATGSGGGDCFGTPDCTTYMINGMAVSAAGFNAYILGQGGSGLEFAFARGSGIGSPMPGNLGALGSWEYNPPTVSGPDDNWHFTITTGGWGFVPSPSQGTSDLFAQGPGKRPPGANGPLQALKQATRGKPNTSPTPNLSPGKWKAPEDIEDYMSWESKAIKYVLDNWDPSTGGSIMLTVDPKLLDPVQRYCMLYPCGT